MLYCQEIRDGKIINFTQDKDIAESLGWINKVDEQDVEKAYDGQIYLIGYAPEKPAKEMAQEKIVELKAELAKSDYIDNKFLEAIVKEDAELLNTLKVKYKDKLEERQVIRNQIDELEEMING